MRGQRGPRLTADVEPGEYDVTLQDGWELSASLGGPFVPVFATLEENPIRTTVDEDGGDIVTFPFSLGRAQLTLGISVQTGSSGSIPPLKVPDGYDGVLFQQSDASYAVILATHPYPECCWETVAAAREDFAGYRLFDPAQ